MPEKKKPESDQGRGFAFGRTPIGELLFDDGLITAVQLDEAIEIQKKTGTTIGQILIEKGYVSEEVMITYIARECGIPPVSLDQYPEINQEVLKLVPASTARRQLIIPLKVEGKKLTVAMADPLNIIALDDIRLTTGLEIIPVLASAKTIARAVEQYYAQEKPIESVLAETEKAYEQEIEKAEQLENLAEAGTQEDAETADKTLEAPVVKLVNMILTRAISCKASDVHFEPYEKSFRVRFRIDGVLHEQPAPPKKLQNGVIARIKVLARVDIAEKRVPQDGRIRMRANGKEIDIRASFLPTVFGEKIVLRLLDSSGLKLNLGALGFEPEQLAIFEKCIKAPYGIVLITGPTGSGKSTTLYSALYVLNQSDKNIVTVEDPVEYMIPGINQVNVRPDVGLSFAEGLRSILRQDPNIVMIGEIRDKETAEIASHAALTGHLVFATLHTNDAPSTVTRLVHLGVEPFLISSSLNLVVAQRLMRVNCSHCKEDYTLEAKELQRLEVPKDQIETLPKVLKVYRGKGCSHCADTGYKGRIGIHELMPISESLREAISRKANALEIKEIAKKEGMITLRHAGLRKVVRGLTSIEEMLRVTG